MYKKRTKTVSDIIYSLLCDGGWMNCSQIARRCEKRPKVIVENCQKSAGISNINNIKEGDTCEEKYLINYICRAVLDRKKGKKQKYIEYSLNYDLLADFIFEKLQEKGAIILYRFSDDEKKTFSDFFKHNFLKTQLKNRPVKEIERLGIWDSILKEWHALHFMKPIFEHISKGGQKIKGIEKFFTGQNDQKEAKEYIKFCKLYEKMFC